MKSPFKGPPLPIPLLQRKRGGSTLDNAIQEIDFGGRKRL
jgi:hypothetical protein